MELFRIAQQVFVVVSVIGINFSSGVCPAVAGGSYGTVFMTSLRISGASALPRSDALCQWEMFSNTSALNFSHGSPFLCSQTACLKHSGPSQDHSE
jgi:hypothetical protein